MSAGPPGTPSCIGRWWLWDSVNLADHHEARAICAVCPALAWCADRTAEVSRGHRGRHGLGPLTGTWAGRLYGRPGRNWARRGQVAS